MLGKRVLSFMLSFCLTAVPVTPDTGINGSQSVDKAGEAVTTQEDLGGGYNGGKHWTE